MTVANYLKQSTDKPLKIMQCAEKQPETNILLYVSLYNGGVCRSIVILQMR